MKGVQEQYITGISGAYSCMYAPGCWMDGMHRCHMLYGRVPVLRVWKHHTEP